jgi:diadenosine tetraphosphate (Ap4A) HIT family hydrolase
MGKKCPFCDRRDAVLENALAYARYDKYPVTRGHVLVIPKRHYSSLFESKEDEILAIWSLLCEAKQLLDAQYEPDGYNIGVNWGTFAGQTIMHLHVHLIPRYKGDIDDPTGGVRGVIPAKQKYPLDA